ncbi:hypothetical protein [Parafrankia soli]|uniref:hypothetical protein n=1 Tax=Parafrankia soli TaxID=2599596 RepID=UPI001F51D857|nr:hypothetical protein [Parafrankia soli]
MTESPLPQPQPAAGDPQTPGTAAPSVTQAVPPQCPTRTRLYRAGSVADEGFPEDSIHPHQRPKVDRYRSHLFANMYAVAVSEESVLTTGEISVFITPRALITVRKDEFDVDALITNWERICRTACSSRAPAATSAAGATN